MHWAEQSFIANHLVYGHGTDNPWDEAVAIARHVLNFPPDQTCDILSTPLHKKQQQILLTLTEQRIKSRKPLPYILKEAWFANEKYYIDERAIIPRSPFAELILSHFQPWLNNIDPMDPSLQILDLATGSGCIAIACSKAFPLAKVDAVDISLAALAVAKINIELHQCHHQVATIHSDLFTNLNKQYDIIVTNPPYVPQSESTSLPIEYGYEPQLALYSGLDGLTCTKRILAQAGQFLTPHGLLFVEVGATWETLQAQYPLVPFMWIELANGGEGIFVFSKHDLDYYKDHFN